MPSNTTPWKERLKLVVNFFTPKCRTADGDSKRRPNIFLWKRKLKSPSTTPPSSSSVSLIPENHYLDLKPLPTLPMDRISAFETSSAVKGQSYDSNECSWPLLNRDKGTLSMKSESDLSTPPLPEHTPYRLHYGPQIENIENMSYFTRDCRYRPRYEESQDNDDGWIKDMDEEVACLLRYGKPKGVYDSSSSRVEAAQSNILRGRYRQYSKGNAVVNSCPTISPTSRPLKSASDLSYKLSRKFSSRVSPVAPSLKMVRRPQPEEATISSSSFSSTSSISSSSSSYAEAAFKAYLQDIQSRLASLEHIVPDTTPSYRPVSGTEPKIPSSNLMEAVSNGKTTIYQRRMLNPLNRSQGQAFRELPNLSWRARGQGSSSRGHTRHDVRSPNMISTSPCTTSFRHLNDQLGSTDEHNELLSQPDRVFKQVLDTEREPLCLEREYFCQHELEKVLMETQRLVKKYEMDAMQDWQHKFDQLYSILRQLEE